MLGATVFIAVGTAVLLLSASPPGAGTMIVFILCLAVSALLSFAPFLIEYDARVRLAEAQARDHIESQLRRLTQTTEQLGNAISRSQSTEEQVGQALGTLEELTEKLNAQTDEIAQTLARSQEREISALRAEVECLVRERDDRLAALEQRLDTANGQTSELLLAHRKAAAVAQKTQEEMKESFLALASRLDEMSVGEGNAAPAPAAPVSSPPAESARDIAAGEPVAEQTKAPSAAAGAPDETPEADHRSGFAANAPAPTPVDNEPTLPKATAQRGGVISERNAGASSTGAGPKPRVHRSSETAGHAPARVSAKPQTLDLPLIDTSDAPPAVHHDASGGTSTLVATAYIGIGNKLYVRGDGPGLSWDQGVPMQFLAIGKWGWTSPEGAEPITCRIYRNDETPMLDENIVLEPGAKAEVTPRF